MFFIALAITVRGGGAIFARNAYLIMLPGAYLGWHLYQTRRAPHGSPPVTKHELFREHEPV